MKNQLKLCILGASGRMGSTIISEVIESKQVMLHSVSEMKDHKWVGRDIGHILNGKNNNVIVSDNLHQTLEGSDVVIDFTQPANTVYCSNMCATLGVAHIIGTTGFNENQEKEILTSSSRIPIVKAGNMSLGINMLTKLVEKVAKSLGKAPLPGNARNIFFYPPIFTPPSPEPPSPEDHDRELEPEHLEEVHKLRRAKGRWVASGYGARVLTAVCGMRVSHDSTTGR